MLEGGLRATIQEEYLRIKQIQLELAHSLLESDAGSVVKKAFDNYKIHKKFTHLYEELEEFLPDNDDSISQETRAHITKLNASNIMIRGLVDWTFNIDHLTCALIHDYQYPWNKNTRANYLLL